MKANVVDDEGFHREHHRQRGNLVGLDDVTSTRINHLIYQRSKIDQIIADFDISKAVCGNIDPDRCLQQALIIEEIASELSPLKLKITTLSDIFNAFMEIFDPTNLDQPGIEYWKKYYVFKYDERLWNGTITCNYPNYNNGTQVKFINIRLPNDGYLYTKQYSAKWDVMVESEVTEVIAMFIEKLNLQEFVDEVDVNYYKLCEGR
eukprot:gene15184-20453_t